MQHEQFSALVKRLDGFAKRAPQRYQWTVMLLACLGSLYIYSVLGLMVVLFTALLFSIAILKAIAIKFILVLGSFLWMIIKALWVKLDAPQGIEIKREQAPLLFAMLDELQRKLKAPRFHYVLLDNEFNACVVQIPRLGIFGWSRNYLCIGMPLLKSLSAAQFKAVLAHEYGHLSKGHGRLSNWIYCQRLRWERLANILNANNSRASFLFKPFLNWFAPYFSAYSFPLARNNEFAADMTSAQLTSSQAAAQALTNTRIIDSYFSERYWPALHRQARDLPQPNFAPYTTMGQELPQQIETSDIEKWLTQAMAVETNIYDTHPALKERLAALAQGPQLSIPTAAESAAQLLEPTLTCFTSQLDEQWKNNIGSAWKERYEEIQTGRSQLAELNFKVEQNETLSIEEALTRARLTEDIAEDQDATITQLKTLYERASGHVEVCFALGSRLLNKKDPQGCGLMKEAMELDEEATRGACEWLRDYYHQIGEVNEAQHWHERLIARAELEYADQQERNTLHLTDKFLAHDLDAQQLATLQNALHKIKSLRKVFLCKKQLTHLPKKPLYIVTFNATAWYQWYSKSRVANLLQQLQQCPALPGETLIVCIDAQHRRFRRKVNKIKGARII